MAASRQKRDRGKMVAQEDKSNQERQAIAAAAKVKNPSLIRTSPYMKRSVIQAAAHKTPPNRSAPVSRKAKSPSIGSTSAPAGSIRAPAGGAPTLNPPLKAKRGASSLSIGAAGERCSVPVIRKEPQIKCTTPHVLVPVRVKRTGLKLLDPEKIKNLTSACRLPASGDMKQKILLHQTAINKRPPWSHKQNILPKSSVKETVPSGKRMGMTSRRENIDQSGRPKSLQSDENFGNYQLGHQMNQLLLDDGGCNESSDSNPPQTIQPADGHTVQGDAGSLEESIGQDNQKSSHGTTSEEPESNDINDTGTLVMDSSYQQKGDVQELLPGDKESLSQPSNDHDVENQATEPSPTEDPPTDDTRPRCPDINVAAEPTTEAHGQDKCQSSHSHLEDTGNGNHHSQPASLVGENNSLIESILAEDNISGPNLPPDEQNARVTGNQEKPSQPVWSRTNDVIRQSQGVLVLTSSTDENAVFIPKLKFDFTPDNSIDWTMLGPPPLDSSEGGPSKKKNPRILPACTPRGPTFSKSVLKKSFLCSGHDLPPGGSSESALRVCSPGDVTRNSSRPLDRIVDLSISFQDKFEEQEIPADVPKILLTEEDHDED